MDSLTLNLSLDTNRVLNADGVTALRQINLVQGETYSVTLSPTGGESLTGIGNFSFALRQKFDTENLIEVTGITSGVFTLPLTSVLLNNALVGHDYRQFRAYIRFTGFNEAEIFDPFFARVATSESGIGLANYVSSFNGQTGDVTYSVSANEAVNAGAVMLTGSQTISGVKTFASGFNSSLGGVPVIRVDDFFTVFNGNGNDVIHSEDMALRNDGTESISWGDRRLYDTSGRLSIDYDYRQLSNLTSVTLDWSGRVLSGNWLTNAFPTQSGHLVNKGFLDAGFVHKTGTETISGSKTFSGLLGPTGYHGYTSQPSIDLYMQQIKAGNGNIVYDWLNGVLYSSTGYDKYIDVGNGFAVWNNSLISWGDTFGLTMSAYGVNTVDAGLRYLYDSSAIYSVAWDYRALVDSSADITLDWELRQLNGGAWTIDTAPTQAGHIVNKGFLDNAVTGGVRTISVSGSQISGAITITGSGNCLVTKSGQNITYFTPSYSLPFWQYGNMSATAFNAGRGFYVNNLNAMLGGPAFLIPSSYTRFRISMYIGWTTNPIRDLFPVYVRFNNPIQNSTTIQETLHGSRFGATVYPDNASGLSGTLTDLGAAGGRANTFRFVSDLITIPTGWQANATNNGFYEFVSPWLGNNSSGSLTDNYAENHTIRGMIEFLV